MSAYCFGGKPGPSTRRERAIAKQHGADCVDYTDAACMCGHGCRPHTCPRSRRHWFELPNRGFPFDQAASKAVLADLEKTGPVAARRA